MAYTQGFPYPTKTPEVRQMIKGIRTLHPAQEKQAAPLLLQHLEQTVNWLEQAAEQAAARHDLTGVLRSRRDIALVLIGFWRGFRGDELSRLRRRAYSGRRGHRDKLLPAAQQRRSPTSWDDLSNPGTEKAMPSSSVFELDYRGRHCA
jgi:hypothetical protein